MSLFGLSVRYDITLGVLGLDSCEKINSLIIRVFSALFYWAYMHFHSGHDTSEIRDTCYVNLLSFLLTCHQKAPGIYPYSALSSSSRRDSMTSLSEALVSGFARSNAWKSCTLSTISSHGLMLLTDAVRLPSFNKAISPKKSPAPNLIGPDDNSTSTWPMDIK